MSSITVIDVLYMAEEKYTSIRLKQSTADQLKEIGRKGESYDDVVAWLLKNSKKRKALYSTEYHARDKKPKIAEASNESDYYRVELAKKNLLDKVFRFQTLDSCPLCEKQVKNGEFVVYLKAGKGRRTLHKDCLEKQGIDVQETEMAHIKDA
jgi:hypothetical protein